MKEKSCEQKLITRIFFRAIRITKDFNQANLIVMGDTLGEFDNIMDCLEAANKIYQFTVTEILALGANNGYRY